MSGSLVDVTGSSWSASLGDTRIDHLIQRLEEACERVSRDESLAVMKDDPASAVYVPLRVREIVQHCLTHPPISSGGGGVRGEGEGRELEGKVGGRMEEELERVRDLLQKTQKENEDLRLKYIAVSEKMEEMFQLQAEVSSLTLQTARLREENSQLQKTLLDQETAFSYALRTCQTEKLDRDDRITRMEKQIQEHGSQCHDLEQQLSSREMTSEEERSRLVCSIRRLEEEVLRVRREREEMEQAHHQELRQAVERVEEEEQKAQELSLVNEQLQQQMAEMQTDSNKLMENVHQLSLTLNQTQERLLGLEAQREESFMIAQDQSARSRQLSLTLALRDVSSVQRELSLTREAIESDLRSGRNGLTHATEGLRTAYQQHTLHLVGENMQLMETIASKQEESQMLSQQLSEAISEREEQKAQHQTRLAELQATLEAVCQELSQEKKRQSGAAALQALEQMNAELEHNQQGLQLQLKETQQALSSVRTEAIDLKNALDSVVKLLTTKARERDEEEVEEMGEDSVLRDSEKEGKDSAHASSQFTVEEVGEASRLRDQVLSLVKHQLKTNRMKLQSLQNELRSREEEARHTVSQLQADLQSQTSANREKLTELETLFHGLTAENQKLQKELESSQRCLEEARIGSSEVASQLEQLKAENLRLQEEQTQTQQQLQTLSNGLQHAEEATANKQAELGDQQERVRQLQTQLCRVSQESDSLKSQLVQVNSQHQEAIEEASGKTRQLDALELERSKLQQELYTSQETVSKLKEALSAEEAEKERVQGMLEATQREVSQLTSSLLEAQEHLKSAQTETNQMKRETTTLSVDLRQHKLALSEAQLQRSQLNSIIAKMAKEKGDLVRERVSLRVQVDTLEDALTLLKKKQVQVSQERDCLEQRVKDIEKRLFLEELNKSLETEVGNSSSINRRSVFDLSSKADYQHKTDGGGGEGDAPLQGILAHLKKKEMELQSGVETCRLEYEARLKQMKETHSDITSSLRRQHESAYNRWRTEMDTLRSSQREQLSKVQTLLGEKDSRIEALRESKEVCKVECSKLGRELTSLQNKMQKLMKEPVKSDGRSFTQDLPCSGQTSRLQAKSDALPEHSLLSKQLKSCQIMFQLIQKEVTFLRERNKLLQSGREELEVAASKAKRKSLMLQSSLTTQTESSDQYQQQVRALVKERDEQKRRQQLRDEEIKTQLMELETKLSLLQLQHEEIQKEKRRIELKLQDSQRKNATTERELFSLKAENTSLVSKLKTAEVGYQDIKTNHSQLLEVLQQVLDYEDDTHLHSNYSGDSVVPVSSIATEQTSTPKAMPLKMQLAWTPQAATQSLWKLKREISSLRKKEQQRLEQSKRDSHYSHEEKVVLEARVQSLQSSLTSLQTSFDSISRQRNKAEVTAKEAKKTICELRKEKEELHQETRNLQQQLQSCRAAKGSMEKKHCELEQKVEELHIERSLYAEQVSSLKCEVSRLQSSILVKDRQLVQLEEKLRNKRGEELPIRQEGVGDELQTHMQSLLSQSQTQAQGLREENARLQKEVLSLSKEVERLRQCLQSTTEDKQRLSQSQEKEINRLRREVERLLQESSVLKVQLLRSGGRSLMKTPVSSTATRLTPNTRMQSGNSESISEEDTSSGQDKYWREQCHKHKITIQHLRSKVSQLENDISATQPPHGNATQEQDETQPNLEPFPSLSAEQTALLEPDHPSLSPQQLSGLEQQVSRGERKGKTTSVMTRPSTRQSQAHIIVTSTGPFTSTPMKHPPPPSYYAHQDTN